MRHMKCLIKKNSEIGIYNSNSSINRRQGRFRSWVRRKDRHSGGGFSTFLPSTAGWAPTVHNMLIPSPSSPHLHPHPIFIFTPPPSSPHLYLDSSLSSPCLLHPHPASILTLSPSWPPLHPDSSPSSPISKWTETRFLNYSRVNTTANLPFVSSPRGLQGLFQTQPTQRTDWSLPKLPPLALLVLVSEFLDFIALSLLGSSQVYETTLFPIL